MTLRKIEGAAKAEGIAGTPARGKTMQKKIRIRRATKRSALLLGTALVGGALAMVLAPGGAYAACNETSTDFYQCSGDDPVSLTVDAIAGGGTSSVEVSNYNIDTNAQDGIAVSVSSNGTGIQNLGFTAGVVGPNNSVHGTPFGIELDNNDADGSITAVIQGTVQSRADDAIFITSTGGNISFTSGANITAGTNGGVQTSATGIFLSAVEQGGDGSGNITVDFSGTIVADNHGIRTRAGTGLTTVDIDLGEAGITSGGHGVWIEGSGGVVGSIAGTIATTNPNVNNTDRQGVWIDTSGGDVGNSADDRFVITADITATTNGVLIDASDDEDAGGNVFLDFSGTVSGDATADGVRVITSGLNEDETSENGNIDILAIGAKIGTSDNEVGGDGISATSGLGNITIFHSGNSIFAAGDGLTANTLGGAITIGNGSTDNPDGLIDVGGNGINAEIESTEQVDETDNDIVISSQGTILAGANGINALMGQDGDISITVADATPPDGYTYDIDATGDAIRAEVDDYIAAPPSPTSDAGNITISAAGQLRAGQNVISAITDTNGSVTVTLGEGTFTSGTNADDSGVYATIYGGGFTYSDDSDTDIDATFRGIEVLATGNAVGDPLPAINIDLYGDINVDGTENDAAGVAGIYVVRGPGVGNTNGDGSIGDIDIDIYDSGDIASTGDGVFAQTAGGNISVSNDGEIGFFDSTLGSLGFSTVGRDGITAIIAVAGDNINPPASQAFVLNSGVVAAEGWGIVASNNSTVAPTEGPLTLPGVVVVNSGVLFGATGGVSATSSTTAYVSNSGLLLGGDWDGVAAVQFSTTDGGFLENSGLIASADTAADLLDEINANPPTSLFDLVQDVIGAVQDGADDLAVSGLAGEVEIDNEGIMIGRVELAAGEYNDVYNDFLWITKGTNVINGDVDNDGWIQTAVGDARYEYTEFTGVENGTWVNNGVISMLDFEEGDFTGIYGASALEGVTFNAEEGSALIVDAFLREPGSESDVLQIGGVDSNAFDGGVATVVGDYSTAVLINDTNEGVGAYNPEGILVVSLPNGNFASDAFVLSELNSGYDPVYDVIDKGFFDYALLARQEGDEDDGFYLVGLPGVEAYQLPSLITGAQSIWHDTTGVWLDRQADLRSYLVNPVEVAPATTIVSKEQGLITKAPATMATQSITPGVWGKALGSWASRDNSATYSILGNSFNYDTGYDQDTYGFIAGADFGKTTGDSAWVFGVLGGYINSKMTFNSAGTTGEYSGGTVGAYATYLSGGFFIDGLVKADFLSLDYDAPSLGGFGYTGESSDVTNLGFTVDTGYRFAWTANAWFEPVATLSYVNTEIDSLVGFEDTTVNFQDGDSLRGAIGARIGGKVYDGAAYWVEASATGRYWYEFEGENSVLVDNLGDDFLAYDDFSGSFGEITGSLNVFGKANGWNGFLNGSYLFNGDYNSGSAKVGVRYQW